jgi:hypothetical protein
MVQPTQHGNGTNIVRLIWRRSRKHRWLRDPLPKPLMGSGLIEVQDIDLEKSREVLFVEDQEVIQAFSSHASQKAFTDGIGSWSSVWRSKHLDATGGRYARQPRPEFPVIILNQIFGVCP